MFDELDVDDNILPNLNLIPNPFKLPSSTPAVVPYPNLIGSTQHTKNNFKPTKRQFKRVASAQENDAALKKVLKDYWGHTDFRGPQLDICRSVLGGWDVMVVAPTGLGKSVCFQVPAIALEYGITLVVSPLLALMKDQVSSLQAKGVKAAMLYEKSPAEDNRYIKRQLKMGHPELRLLYLTPETLFSRKIEYELDMAYQQKQIRRLVVDEAHVIEEWGMTFRAAYRDLGKFRLKFPDIPVTALTASATEEVRADILDILRIQRKELAQWVEPFNRKNLFYEIRYQGNVGVRDKSENIASFITNYRPEAQQRNVDNGIRMRCVSGLVYCRSRGSCEDVAEILRQKGISAQPFHAKLSDERRNQLLDMWKQGMVECIVATIAFGMGVDQAHVRYVIHYDMPKSFEGYYQETGRAGRDGHASRCILYYSREDAKSLRFLLETEAKRIAAARKKQEQGNGETQYNQAEVELDKAKMRCINSFKILQHYAEADTVCRHVAICRYFGEKIDQTNSNVREAYCGGMCDVCSNPGAVKRRATTVSENLPIASQVVRSHQPLTVQSLSVPSSDDPIEIPDTLRLLHGKALAGISSDPSEELQSAQKSEAQVEEDAPVYVDGTGSSSVPPPPKRSTILRSSADATKAKDDFTWLDSAKTISRASQSSQPEQATSSSPLPSLVASIPQPDRRPIPSRPSEVEAARPLPSAQQLRRTRSIGMVMDSPGGRLTTAETPCPPPARKPRITRESDTARAGPSRLARPTTTDRFAAGHGGYAVADPLPVDPEKRQRQQEAFRAVTPITGRGPYSYYTNTAAPTVDSGRKRKLSTASETGLGFRTPFKTPFIKQKSKQRAGTISESARMESIAAIRDGLRKCLLDGRDLDGLWDVWDRRGMSDKDKKGLIRHAAVELESVLVRQCATPDMLKSLTEQLVQAIRILRTPEGVNILLEGRLGDYKDDAHGRMLILLHEAMRGLGG